MNKILAILLFAILPVACRGAAAAVTIDPTTKNLNTAIGGSTVTTYNIPSGTSLIGLSGSVVNLSAATVTLPGSVFGTFANGTVSAPSVTFTSDTNTGIYRIGSDELGITTGGINSAIFDPGSITTGQLLTTRTDGDYQYRMTNNAQGWGIAISGASGALLIDDTTAGLNRFAISTTSGRVGIGNATPAYQLDVTGDGHFTTNMVVAGITSTTSGTTASLVQNATADIATLSTAGAYRLHAIGGNNSVSWYAACVVYSSGSTLSIQNLANANIDVTNPSGTTLRLTNLSVTTNTLKWALIRLL